MIPILNPAGVQELIDYGLYGFALSRFAGTWAAIKCVKDNIESTASVDASLERLNIVMPEFDMPPGGLNIRNEIDLLGQEARLHEYKRAAASAFIRANGLNRIVYSGGTQPEARHHHGRQELSRRAPGAGRYRHRRGAGPTGSASACSRSAAHGRSISSTSRTSRAASKRSSSSRRSAR